MITAGGSHWQHHVPKTASVCWMPCHCGMCVQGERDIHTYVVCTATQVACTVLRSCLLFPYPLPLIHSWIFSAKDWGRAKDGKSACSCLPHSVDWEVGHVLYLVHTRMYVSLQVTIIPSTHRVRLLCSPLGRTWGFRFPGGHGSFRLLLCPLTSWLGLFYTPTFLLCKYYWCTTGVIFPPSVLDQDSVSWDFK